MKILSKLDINFDLSELKRNYMDGEGNIFNTVYSEEDLKRFINFEEKLINSLLKKEITEFDFWLRRINLIGEDLCSLKTPLASDRSKE